MGGINVQVACQEHGTVRGRGLTDAVGEVSVLIWSGFYIQVTWKVSGTLRSRCLTLMQWVGWDGVALTFK